MDNPGEIMRLCRLCLVKDQVNIPIFDEQGDIRQIFLKISSCLPVKVSREDPLPKSICDGCSNKLDLLYEFRNTSANAEKTLLSWVGQADAKDVDETVTAAAHQVAKPSETQVKQEEVEESNPAPVQDIESMDAQESATFDESSAKDEEEEEPPPPKRARRTAAVKAQINIAPDSDDEDDDDDDLDGAEPMTKIEDESEESDDDKDPSYQDVPGTSADDQPGPSGVGKDGVEAPKVEPFETIFTNEFDDKSSWGFYDDDNKPIERDEEFIDPFPCNLCRETFKTESCLKIHMRDHNPNSRRKKCLNCNEQCSEGSFRTHVLRCKKARYKVKCLVCRKLFDSSNFTRHMKTHNEKKIKCAFCGKLFREECNLENHILAMHANTPLRFPCDVCGQIFFEKSQLNIHKSRTHVKKYNYICSRCQRGFMYIGNLKAHIQGVHKKGFVCSFESCKRAFTSPAGLKSHEQAHTKYNVIFACSHCGKHFTDPTYYKDHQKTHENI